MIKLVVRQADECTKAFILEGHAGYDDYGFDIVCSGVSALAISAANGLSEFTNAELNVEQNEGYLSCEILNLDALDEINRSCASGIINTMVLGIESIASQYPETITIEYIKI